MYRRTTRPVSIQSKKYLVVEMMMMIIVIDFYKSQALSPSGPIQHQQKMTTVLGSIVHHTKNKKDPSNAKARPKQDQKFGSFSSNQLLLFLARRSGGPPRLLSRVVNWTSE